MTRRRDTSDRDTGGRPTGNLRNPNWPGGRPYFTQRDPRDPRPRARTLSTHVFSGLVRCPQDGSILTTTWRTTRQGREVGLLCRQGRIDRNHPRPYSLPEGVVLDWAKAATAEVLSRRQAPQIIEPGEAQNTTRRVADLQTRRTQITQLATMPGADMDVVASSLADIEAEIARLSEVAHAEEVWTIGLDWTLPPASLNAHLRDLLHSIRPNAAMRPCGAVWRRRPWRVMDGYEPERVYEMAEDDAYDPHAIAVDGGWFLPTQQRQRHRAVA